MSAAPALNYQPEPTPALFHACDDFCRGIMGPVGSGKSVACTLEMFFRAVTQKPFETTRNGRRVFVRKSRWAAVRNTYPELKTTTINTFQDWFPPDIAKFKYDIPITARIDKPLADGTFLEMEILFLAMDREKDVKKLKSLELTGVWLNEAVELSKGVLDMCTSRVGRYPAKRDGGPSWRGIIMDTNPPDDDHWYYDLAEVRKPMVKLPSGEILRYTFFRQPPALLDGSEDGQYIANPRAENIRNLEGGHGYYYQQLPGKTKEWIRVFVQGNYGTIHDGRPVYPEYNDSVHCSAEPLELYHGVPIRIGFDFGLTPACLLGQLTPDGQLRWFKEFITDGSMGIYQFAREVVVPHLKNELPSNLFLTSCDPAGRDRSQVNNEMSCIRELQKAGIPAEPAHTNAVIPRREAVAYFLLRQNGFMLDGQGCPVTRKGFNGGYKFERKAIGGEERMYRDEPMKNRYSHPHDAGQYMALKIIKDLDRPHYRRREVRRASAAGWT